MPPFHFRLETLLKLRCIERDRYHQELTEVLDRQKSLQESLDAVDEEIVELSARERSAFDSKNTDMVLIRDLGRHKMLLGEKRTKMRRQMELLVEEVEACRVRLLEADRAVKTLEKLREKQRLQHRIEQQRAEIKEFDEIAALRDRDRFSCESP